MNQPPRPKFDPVLRLGTPEMIEKNGGDACFKVYQPSMILKIQALN